MADTQHYVEMCFDGLVVETSRVYGERELRGKIEVKLGDMKHEASYEDMCKALGRHITDYIISDIGASWSEDEDV